MKCLNYLVLLILISCSNAELRQDIDATAYRTSGVEQFFLPELPNWANFSAAGRCFKASSFQYMDFSKLAGSYKLNYVQMLELQAQYNQRLEDYFRSNAQRFLRPVEEASFFSNTLEQVKGGIRQFKVPQVPEVEVIWLEGYLQTNEASALTKLAQTGRFDSKLPVLFSSCHSKQTLVQWITENKLDQVGFYQLTAEYLSPYNSENVSSAGLRIEILKLFNTGTKVSFFPELSSLELITK